MVILNGLVSPQTGLTIRLVNRDWRKIIDDFYSRRHRTNSCLAPCAFPTVTIKVPLDETRAQRISDFAETKNCRFVGGRVKLLLSDTKNQKISVATEDASIQTVFKRVTHLTILEEKRCSHSEDELAMICRPFLSLMPNVTTFSCTLDKVDVELILSLPNPEKLEFIGTSHIFDIRTESSDDWTQVFEKCSKNLKIFSCLYFSPGMERALPLIRGSIEEIRFTYHYKEVDYDGEENDEDGSSYILGLNRDGLLFPKLTRISVPLVRPFWMDEDDEEGEWEIPRLLTQMSAKLVSLEEIELRVRISYVELCIEEYPIPLLIVGQGSRNIRRMVVIMRKLTDDAIMWTFNLAAVWPSIKTLKINHLEYVKDGEEWWDNVSGALFCTSCR